MSAPLAARLKATLVALAVTVPAMTGTAWGQGQPADTQPQSKPASQAPAAPRSGYNPGEILKDLVNPVVAEVDGHQITLAEVGDAIRALPPNMRDVPFEDLYPAMLDRVIQQHALVMKARRERLDRDPTVQRHMQEAADRVLENEVLNRLADSSVTEDALLARYQKEYADKPGPEEASVRVILLPSEEQARKAIAELTAGADFATLAKRDSKDASASSGGDLGFLRQDKLTPELGAAAFVLAPGQVSPNPIRSRAGWFVIKVDARRRVAPPGYAEVREQLRRDMLREGVARIAREALAAAGVRKYNINGSGVGESGEDRKDTTAGSR